MPDVREGRVESLQRLAPQAQQTVTELARQLGLTPVSRLRAGVVHERQKGPEEETVEVTTIEEYRRRLMG